MKKQTSEIIALSVCFLIMLCCFGSCSDSDGKPVEASGISAINLFFQSDHLELAVGERSAKMHITVTAPHGFEQDDIEFVCENTGVAKINYEKTALTSFIYFTVEGIGEGETDVYFSADGGKIVSDKIHVTVHTANDVTNAETTDAATSEPDTTAVETEDPAQQITMVSETEHTPGNRTVYITPSGTKYHYSASCAGANATPQDENTAALTRDPCKKCVVGSTAETEYILPADTEAVIADDPDVGDSTTVYITPTGKKYHLSASCAGKNAIPTTIENAQKTYDPCKKCAQ